jgi:hypothetical protein
MPKRTTISKDISQKEVEKRINAQYLAVKESMAELCDLFEEDSFEDMIHGLTQGYISEFWVGGGYFDIEDAFAFLDSLRLLVRVGRSVTSTQEDLEESIHHILSIDSVQGLEDLLYFIIECSCNESHKWDDPSFRDDMFFMARQIKGMLRECAKLTGHDMA